MNDSAWGGVAVFVVGSVGMISGSWWLALFVVSLSLSAVAFVVLVDSLSVPAWWEGSDRLAPAYVPRGFVGTVKMPPIPDEILNGPPPPSAAPIPQNRKDSD